VRSYSEANPRGSRASGVQGRDVDLELRELREKGERRFDGGICGGIENALREIRGGYNERIRNLNSPVQRPNSTSN
jgi:hypothetical protein